MYHFSNIYEQRRTLQWLGIVVIGLFYICAQFCSAQTDQDEKIHYRFTQNKTNYSVFASFTSPLAMSEILNILFAYNHVKDFTKSVDLVQLIDEGEKWNRIRFRQCELFGCVDATYLRDLEEKSWKLKFVMENYHGSKNIFIPRIITSSGYYQIKLHTHGSLVEFFQTVDLEDSILLAIYQRYAESKTIDFIEGLYEYLQETPQ